LGSDLPILPPKRTSCYLPDPPAQCRHHPRAADFINPSNKGIFTVSLPCRFSKTETSSESQNPTPDLHNMFDNHPAEERHTPIQRDIVRVRAWSP
jgi:hypothetical protein